MSKEDRKTVVMPKGDVKAIKIDDDFLIELTGRYLMELFDAKMLDSFNVAKLAMSAKPSLETFVEKARPFENKLAQWNIECPDTEPDEKNYYNLFEGGYRMFWSHYPVLQSFCELVESFTKDGGMNDDLICCDHLVCGSTDHNLEYHWEILRHCFKLKSPIADPSVHPSSK